MNDTDIRTPASTPSAAAAAQVTASSGSSFYLAMRILPATQRDAMYQVYAFCRAVDDIADSDRPREERHAALNAWRENIDACYADAPHTSQPSHPLCALTQAINQFGLHREDFHAVIDGMAMDAAADICAPDEATLDLYCDRVASAVGRLSVKIFGMADEPGRALSHHLGRALQLTNILRDIDEDAGIHRCYLPRELLLREGITALEDPHAIAAHPALPRVCATLAQRAQQHFAQADAIMDAAPRAQVKAPRIMAGVYRCLLHSAIARGFNPPRHKIAKPRLKLLWIVARYMLF